MNTRRAFLAALALLFVSSMSSAQLGICSTTPITRATAGAPLTLAQNDGNITASIEMCQLDLQDWPVAAARLDLSGATAIVLPQGTSDPGTCTASPADLFFRTDTAEIRYCSATNVWSSVGGGGVSDGDKGDITISSSGAVYTIDAGAVDADELASTAVTPGSYGDANRSPIIVVDADGRLTSASEVLITYDLDGDGDEEMVFDGFGIEVDADSDGDDDLYFGDGYINLAQDGGANSVRIALSGDRLFHDTDTDGVKDAGEEFIDQAGGGASITVEEEDGTPTVASVTEINVSNGTLTDNGSGSVSILTSGGGLPSLRNASGSENAASCEFSSLCSGWAWGSGVVTGTINPLDSHTGDRKYDFDLWDGWLAWQSDNGSGADILTKLATVSTDATLVGHFRVPIVDTQDIGLESNEGGIALFFRNDSSGYSDSINLFMNEDDGGGFATFEFICVNGGTEELRAVLFDSSNSGMVPAIYKDSNEYYFYVWSEVGGYMYLGQCSKTGTTTMDKIGMYFRKANETPSLVQGVDFVRLYDTHVWDLWQ